MTLRQSLTEYEKGLPDLGEAFFELIWLVVVEWWEVIM